MDTRKLVYIHYITSTATAGHKPGIKCKAIYHPRPQQQTKIWSLTYGSITNNQFDNSSRRCDYQAAYRA